LENLSNIKTLGELKSSGWKSRSVKDELRENLKKHIADGIQIFDSIKGYDKTVIPQIEHAILSKHDIILLGLRGQAKTKILRSLYVLLDEFMPVITGTELREDPLSPISQFAKELISQKGDETPISWIHRSERYAEKLATPDTNVADLIGDIDPIKAATLRKNLSDEDVINYGLIPRSNRGLFAINELPDLQPRIQVALLNIMQERDIQIRGFNVRVPLDVAMVFSANPEDYTNRGNIITPLKDRIDSQIITHYPKNIETGIQITDQEAWVNRSDEKTMIPYFVKEIIEQIAFEARNSEYVDQKSGVSARLTITTMEHVISSAERRSLKNDGESLHIRMCDIFHAVPALTGKLELVYEGEQEGAVSVAKHLIGKAVHVIFKKYFPDPREKKTDSQTYVSIISWFSKGHKVEIADDSSLSTYIHQLNRVDGLSELVQSRVKPTSEPEKLIMMDFVLEALHQNSMLGKDDLDDARTFSDMVGSMLGSLGNFGSDSDDFERL